MLPTLADVLRLDAVRRGEPRVVAGADRLDARVRWVHSAEVTDIAHLLRGGELVLTTGIALPDEPERLRTYVAELAEVGASGLIVELGRKYARTLPAALISAAEEYGLPLIAWARETPFVDVTEAVHAQIIDAQLAELRASEKLHEVFTQLSVDGAPPVEVLAPGRPPRGAARRAGEPRPPGARRRDRRGRPDRAAGQLGDAVPRRTHRGAHRLRRVVPLAGDRGRRARRGLGAADHRRRRAADARATSSSSSAPRPRSRSGGCWNSTPRASSARRTAR